MVQLLYFPESLINKLKEVVNDCCLKIDEQMKLSLSSIEPDVIRLLFDDKFESYFLQNVNNRYIEFVLFLI